MIEKILLDEKLTSPIAYGILGDTYVYANEREVEVQESVKEMDEEGNMVEGEPKTVVKYEYDVRHFPLSDHNENGVITALKKQLVEELTAFDHGRYAKYGDKAVEDFTVGGIHMWLDKYDRNGLLLRFEAQAAQGQTETILWYGTTPLRLSIQNATQMLYALEVYASACFDRTASHHQAIESLTSLEEIFNYDYTTGYPEHLNFPL